MSLLIQASERLVTTTLDIPRLRERDVAARLVREPGAALLEGWSDAAPVRIVLPWPVEIRALPWSRSETWPELLASIDYESDCDVSEDVPFAGGWVGFVSYEAGALAEGAPLPKRLPAEPAAWFARHERAIVIDGDSNALLVCPESDVPDAQHDLHEMLNTPHLRRAGRSEKPVRDSLGGGEYAERVKAIRKSIANGDVYQVNLTRSFTALCEVDPVDLYLSLTRSGPPRCSALMRGAGWTIASASPEVFLRFDASTGIAESRPIKGTVRRSGDDAHEIATLLASEKDASEHLMIVDLVRNDLGKIAPTGCVEVTEFRTVKTLEHVHHLESTVRARNVDASLADLFRTLFPAGSITGAPKRAAVREIRRLESAPRGVYTGAIGYWDRRRRGEWSVAIRTAIATSGDVRYHAGGGIVWDSDPVSEERESIAKSIAFLEYFEAGE